MQKKCVIHSSVGPFLIDGQKVREEKKMAYIWSSQYENICSIPRTDIDSVSFIDFLKDDSDIIGMCKPNMSDIIVDVDTTKKVISKLNNNAAMGPDGLPVQVFKYGGKLIIESIMDIRLESMKTGVIPQNLKIGWITPISQSGKVRIRMIQ